MRLRACTSKNGNNIDKKIIFHVKIQSQTFVVMLHKKNNFLLWLISAQYITPTQKTTKVSQLSKIQEYIYAFIQHTKILVTCQNLVTCFYLGWSGSILQIRTNKLKVGSKVWLYTCSSNTTLSLPSCTVSAL